MASFELNKLVFYWDQKYSPTLQSNSHHLQHVLIEFFSTNLKIFESANLCVGGHPSLWKIRLRLRVMRFGLYFMNPILIDLYGFGLARIASFDFVSGNRFLRMGLTLGMKMRGFISKCVGVLENRFTKIWNPIYHFPCDWLRRFLWNWLILNFHTFSWRHNWTYMVRLGTH